MDNWKDENFVRKWDENQFEGNPIRKEQLEIVRYLIEKYYISGEFVLDIGLGSGILQEMLLAKNPEMKFLGFDSSDAMFNLAKNRLGTHFENIEYIVDDLDRFAKVEFPVDNGQVAVSIQTMHNVPHELKVEIFKRVFEWLKPGGIFILMDRTRPYPPETFQVFKNLWNYLEEKYNTTIKEGENYEEHSKKLEEKGDYPLTLVEHILLLERAGFKVMVAHLVANRVVVTGLKP